MRLSRPFVFAALAEGIHSIALLVSAIRGGPPAFLSGAIGHFILMGSIAIIYLVTRRRWVRLIFAGLEYAAGVGLLVVGIAAMGSIHPGLVGYASFFFLVGIAASMQQAPPDSSTGSRGGRGTAESGTSASHAT